MEGQSQKEEYKIVPADDEKFKKMAEEVTEDKKRRWKISPFKHRSHTPGSMGQPDRDRDRRHRHGG